MPDATQLTTVGKLQLVIPTAYQRTAGRCLSSFHAGLAPMVLRRRGLKPTRLAFERDGDTPVPELEPDAELEPEPEPEPAPLAPEEVAAAEAQTLRRLTRLSLAEGVMDDPSSPDSRADRLGLNSLPTRLPALRITSSFETVFRREQPAEQLAESQEVEAEPDAGAPQLDTEGEWGADLEAAAAAELEAAAAELGCAAEPTDGALEEMDLDAIQAELDSNEADAKVDLDALAAELDAEQDSLAALAAQLDAAEEAVEVAPQRWTPVECAAVQSAAPATPPRTTPTPGHPPAFELKNLVWIDHPALRTLKMQTQRKNYAMAEALALQPVIRTQTKKLQRRGPGRDTSSPKFFFKEAKTTKKATRLRVVRLIT